MADLAEQQVASSAGPPAHQQGGTTSTTKFSTTFGAKRMSSFTSAINPFMSNNPSTSAYEDNKLQLEVHEWVEVMGMGKAQLVISNLGYGIWLMDGAELILLSSLIRAVAQEWQFTSMERGIVVGIVFFGVLVGNVLSGSVGDSLGRRSAVLASYLLVGIFSVASVFSWDLYSICCFRFGVGFAFGIGQPSGIALANETVPTDWRIFLSFVGGTYFVLGEMYSIVLICYDDIHMQDLNWRWLILMGAVPSLLWGVAALLRLPESPSWLHSKGRLREAVECLDWMRRQNFEWRKKGSSLHASTELARTIEQSSGLYPDDFAPRVVADETELAPNSIWRVPIHFHEEDQEGAANGGGSAANGGSRRTSAAPLHRATTMEEAAEETKTGDAVAAPAAGELEQKEGDETGAKEAAGEQAAAGAPSMNGAASGSAGTKNKPPPLHENHEYHQQHPSSKKTFMQRFVTVILPPHVATTCFLVFSTFTCNVVYYGGMYVFPQVLADMGDTLSIPAAYSLFIACFWELLGAAIALAVGDRVSRKKAMVIWLISGSTFIFMFIAALPSLNLDAPSHEHDKTDMNFSSSHRYNDGEEEVVIAPAGAAAMGPPPLMRQDIFPATEDAVLSSKAAPKEPAAAQEKDPFILGRLGAKQSKKITVQITTSSEKAGGAGAKAKGGGAKSSPTEESSYREQKTTTRKSEPFSTTQADPQYRAGEPTQHKGSATNRSRTKENRREHPGEQKQQNRAGADGEGREGRTPTEMNKEKGISDLESSEDREAVQTEIPIVAPIIPPAQLIASSHEAILEKENQQPAGTAKYAAGSRRGRRAPSTTTGIKQEEGRTPTRSGTTPPVVAPPPAQPKEPARKPPPEEPAPQAKTELIVKATSAGPVFKEAAPFRVALDVRHDALTGPLFGRKDQSPATPVSIGGRGGGSKSAGGLGGATTSLLQTLINTWIAGEGQEKENAKMTKTSHEEVLDPAFTSTHRSHSGAGTSGRRPVAPARVGRASVAKKAVQEYFSSKKRTAKNGNKAKKTTKEENKKSEVTMINVVPIVPDPPVFLQHHDVGAAETRQKQTSSTSRRSDSTSVGLLSHLLHQHDQRNYKHQHEDHRFRREENTERTLSGSESYQAFYRRKNHPLKISQSVSSAEAVLQRMKTTNQRKRRTSEKRRKSGARDSSLSSSSSRRGRGNEDEDVVSTRTSSRGSGVSSPRGESGQQHNRKDKKDTNAATPGRRKSRSLRDSPEEPKTAVAKRSYQTWQELLKKQRDRKAKQEHQILNEYHNHVAIVREKTKQTAAAQQTEQQNLEKEQEQIRQEELQQAKKKKKLGFAETLLEIGLFGQKFAVIIGFQTSYVMAIEMFPTSVRATGMAVALAGGRIGAIVAPSLYEKILLVTNSPAAFFFFLIAMLGINFFLLLVLPLRETAGRPLTETDSSSSGASEQEGQEGTIAGALESSDPYAPRVMLLELLHPGYYESKINHEDRQFVPSGDKNDQNIAEKPRNDDFYQRQNGGTTGTRPSTQDEPGHSPLPPLARQAVPEKKGDV
ncbi:unnamed protein product [Amoebophrya sp. A120]|nr:unnamed protein product [Amoebophrya sp. A120]|eukprot:GSA120T00016815001.1